jgi:PAS domain S-box-containing protein
LKQVVKKKKEQKQTRDGRKGQRRRAEKTLRTRPSKKKVDALGLRRLVQELEIHQVELKNQNEELRRAQVQLVESRDRYSELYEFAPLAYVTMDRHGSVLESNRMATQMLGMEPRDLRGARFTKFVTTESQDTFYLHLQAVSSSETTQVCEIRIRSADGSLRSIRVESVSAGRPQVLSAFIDLTERKQAGDAIGQLAAIIESSDDAIVSKDLNGVIMSWNKGAEKLFGYAAEEVIGKSIMIVIPPDRANEETRVLESIRSGKKIDHYETVRLRKNGSLVEISLTVSPIRDKSGNIIGASKIARDISERKRTEEKIARLLTEEQSAREVAQNATRAKDQFIALVSHELRSPLNAILGWNRLLRAKRGGDHEIVKVTETIERNGHAQLQLIEDLLDTARIISGKMKLEFEPVEPVAIISEALDTVRPSADSKGVIVLTDLDPDAGQITGDPGRLRQVVWNLLSNAVKFTPGGGRIRIELRRGGAGVQIVVSDTGRGISPDLLPYVFDRFKQADSETSRRHGGLGLGLALVKHLVELHGGTVIVESPGVGQGATFIVNLPLRAIKAVAGAERGETEVNWHAGRPTRTTKLEGVRALVVDDEPGALELLSATLDQYGVFVTGVDSIEAAVAAIDGQLGEETSEPFDILICDIEMPGGDGYELMKRLRTHTDERVRRIRAIALTAYGRTEDRLRALQAGFQMQVSKPIDEEELTTVIRALINRF